MVQRAADCRALTCRPNFWPFHGAILGLKGLFALLCTSIFFFLFLGFMVRYTQVWHCCIFPQNSYYYYFVIISPIFFLTLILLHRLFSWIRIAWSIFFQSYYFLYFCVLVDTLKTCGSTRKKWKSGLRVRSQYFSLLTGNFNLFIYIYS